MARGKGKPLDRKGYFIEPTIFADRCHGEILPMISTSRSLISVIKLMRSVEEVIERANSSKYGLAAGIMTNNLNIANTVSRVIWINCYFAFNSDAPFGGYKMSGFDREMGMESLSKYLQVKTIATPVYNSPWL
nr:aldehyde dehydrogenase family 2 member C4 [Ipomoea batatas]